MEPLQGVAVNRRRAARALRRSRKKSRCSTRGKVNQVVIELNDRIGQAAAIGR